MHTSETPRLYARDPLLHSLVPGLTGLAYDRRARVPWEYDKDLPVVLLTGRHGMGRTAVLTALQSHYTGRLPLAHLDTAACDLVVELLEELVCALAPDLGRRFPLLLPGLVAVVGGHRDNEAERSRAAARVARLLVACDLEPGGRAEAAQNWASRVRARLEEAAGRPEAAEPPAAQEPRAPHPRAQQARAKEPSGAARAHHDPHAVHYAVLAEYFERYTRARSAAPLRQWYQERYAETARNAAVPEGQDGLVRLAEWFHRGGDYRRAAEQTLVHAFLTDVEAARSKWQRLNRDPRPLVLLDNTHSAAGERLIDLILEHRARPDAAHHDPLVVVATRLGDPPPAATDAVRCELPDLVGPFSWRRTGHAPSAGLLVVPLTPLSRDDILLMLDSAAVPLHPYLASALHTLTGGHPLACALLCEAVLAQADAVAADPAAGPLGPRDLLDLTTKDAGPVSRVILERLLPAQHQRQRLVPLSLARDSTAAQALAAHLRLDGPEQLPANAAADYLEAEQWQHDTPQDRPLAADPLLHTLLVHEARRTSQGSESRRGWQEIHGFLRRHHTTRGEDSEADALRHTLAAGDARTVVAALSEEYHSEQDRPSALRWLDCLRYAATAPAPPSADWADVRAATAAGAHDDRYQDIDEIDRCINRLLHGLWYLSDAHAEPEADLCDDIGAELAFLSLRHQTWRAVLSQAARTWPAAARDKRPLPLPEL
ncbi:ATP-binding protein [Streptomyces sp. NPDC087300]|uniref:ATP-binding protein n=1 Tax=Streptomyces sp. NPDC087300 TaxID=3365780 RepID=UPI00382A8DDD